MGAQLQLIDVPATGKKISRRKPATVNRIKVDHEIAKERYYHHRRLKFFGFGDIDGTTRIIDASPYDTLEAIPKKPRKHIKRLMELGYNVQLKIS